MAHIREVGITAADMCAYAWHMETTLDGEQVLSDEGYSAFDEERWAPEPPKSKSRTAFERDRARLIHSSALRRLGAKSQILIAGTDDFARTRLTHTLEVAQIGRQIGALLGCDPDVVDCACLAHDLGHPPFGHNGERALADIAGNIGGFEGNAQTMRILTRLEPKIFHPDGRSAGVNLTRAALDAAVKYPWTLAEADQHPKGERSKKFCVYPDDEPVFRWLKIGAPQATKPMECQIMDLSDDIAYSVHDVEDSIATHRKTFGEEPSVIWLQNHGIFVAANSTDEVKAIYIDVLAKLEGAVKEPLPVGEVELAPAILKTVPGLRMLLSTQGLKTLKVRARRPQSLRMWTTVKSWSALRPSVKP